MIVLVLGTAPCAGRFSGGIFIYSFGLDFHLLMPGPGIRHGQRILPGGGSGPDHDPALEGGRGTIAALGFTLQKDYQRLPKMTGFADWHPPCRG